MTKVGSQDHLLVRLALPAFVPFPLLRSGFLQTVAGAYWPQRPDPGLAEHHEILLESGAHEPKDRTIVTTDTPAGWRDGDRVALLVHGLAGDHLSSYMIRLARKLNREGMLVVRMNLRNSGIAFGLSRKTYHAGITGDVRSVLGWIARKFPGSPVTAMGFSLGGNLLLKMAGEDAGSITAPIDSLIAVSPAVDLSSASRKLGDRPGSLIAAVFLRQLLKDVARLSERYPELTRVDFPRKMTIRDFDELHVAAMHGFKGADDYYERCSSLPQLSRISVPTLIIGSKDDPVVDVTGLEKALLPDHIDVVLTEHGGHVGFVGFGKTRSETRWADTVSIAWLRATIGSKA